MIAAQDRLDKALTTDMRRTLTKMEQKLGQLDQYESCGIDCTEFRASLQYLIGEHQKILATFGFKE